MQNQLSGKGSLLHLLPQQDAFENLLLII